MAGRIPDGGGQVLLGLARGAIAERLGVAAPPLPRTDPAVVEAWLRQPGATFVTLTQGGRLRGCIGSLVAYRPLVDDVRGNACNAAFRDPRFARLERDELARTRVEVSLLSAPEPVSFTSEAEAMGALRPGVDGAILSAGRHRGTFLPQVWEELPEPRDFWLHLKRKAGLPLDFWGDDVRLERYTVTAWQEDADD